MLLQEGAMAPSIQAINHLFAGRTPRTGDMFAPDDPDYYVMGPGSADW